MSKWGKLGFQAATLPWDDDWHDDWLSEQEFWIMFARSHGALTALRCYERRWKPTQNADDAPVVEDDPNIIFAELRTEMLGAWMIAESEDDTYYSLAQVAEMERLQANNEAELALLLRTRLLDQTLDPKLRERWTRWLYSNARRMWPMPEDYDTIPAFMAAHYNHPRRLGT